MTANGMLQTQLHQREIVMGHFKPEYATDDDVVDRTPRFEPRPELLEEPWINLSVAMQLLLYGTVAEQTNEGCFNPSDNGLAKPGSFLFGLPPEQHPSAVYALERRFSKAGRHDTLAFRGVRTFNIGAWEEHSPAIPTKQRISTGYFGVTRGFDFETDRINLASFFGDPLAFDAAYDEARRSPRGEYWAWTDVEVGRDGLARFLQGRESETDQTTGPREHRGIPQPAAEF
jgi:hypothetical protein